MRMEIERRTRYAFARPHFCTEAEGLIESAVVVHRELLQLEAEQASKDAAGAAPDEGRSGYHYGAMEQAMDASASGAAPSARIFAQAAIVSLVLLQCCMARRRRARCRDQRTSGARTTCRASRCRRTTSSSALTTRRSSTARTSWMLAARGMASPLEGRRSRISATAGLSLRAAVRSPFASPAGQGTS